MTLSTQHGEVWIHTHGEGPPALALHGFTQTGGSYGELGGVLHRALLAPDLPGHGRTRVRPVGLDTAVAVIEAVAGSHAPLPVIGYSQGGRVALHHALRYPATVSALVLISTGTGSPDPAVRAQRRRSDEALARRLEEEPLEGILDEWLARPMFAGLAGRERAWRERDYAMRLTNTGHGLSRALRGYGQGACPFVGDRLSDLAMPVLLIAGSDDPPYVTAAQTMAASIPDARLEIIEGAGHAAVGEAPQAVGSIIGAFLEEVLSAPG